MKKNLPLIIAISLPIVFFLVLAFTIIIPSMSIETEYDFIFSLKEDRYSAVYWQDYILRGDNIELIDVDKDDNFYVNNNQTVKDAPTLYLFDIKSGEVREIDLKEANSKMLYAGQVSPDGYLIDLYPNHNYDLLDDVFGVGSNDQFFTLEKDQTRKKIKIPFKRTYYNSLSFIAWTK